MKTFIKHIKADRGFGVFCALNFIVLPSIFIWLNFNEESVNDVMESTVPKVCLAVLFTIYTIAIIISHRKWAKRFS